MIWISRQAWMNESASNFPKSMRPGSVTKNDSRFADARLHAVSSRNMYSEHGLEARMRPPAGQVCHSFIVVLKCRPGSADSHAARAMLSQRYEASSVLTTFPS